MIVFPNAKINLGLSVHGRRYDGYHDLETVFYPVPVKDILEVITFPAAEAKAANINDNSISFSITGLPVPGNRDDNLCLKAYALLKSNFPLPPVKMHLHKQIPIGAGLGGGSADGAFALRLLNEKFQLELTTPELIDYALQLGSDCPFFIINKPCYASSRGEMLEQISLDLSAYCLVLINPGIHVDTAWAFRQPGVVKEEGAPVRGLSLQQIMLQPVTDWKELLVNDLEAPVFSIYPQIRDIKEKLYGAGAVYAAMSGSGSTVFGLFPAGKKPVLQFPAGYLVLHCPLLPGH